MTEATGKVERRVRGKQRQAVAERACHCCEYCRCPEYIGTQAFSVEHILAREHGGTNATNNLALSCQGCNGHKYTKREASDPATGVLVPLFHPRRQHWRDHFSWNEDFTLILGLTPTGRATEKALRLNREEVVRFRRVLRAVGEHPPPEPQE